MSQMGHVCVGEASDGKEAIEAVLRALPDLVFVDIVLPKKNGLEVIQEIQDHWQQAKIIAMSTLKQEDLQTEIFRSDDIAFLQKPFQQYDIRRILESFQFANAEVDQ
jgi:YesN/AraC family two-component response regulator